MYHHRQIRTAEAELAALCGGLFMAGVFTCALLALHRIAAALKLQARVVTYHKLRDELSDEEKKVVLTKIKEAALHRL